MSLRPYACVLWSIALSGGAAVAAEVPIEIFAPLPAAERQVAVLPPGSAPAASELAAAAQCHPAKRRASLVSLRWQPSAAGQDGEASEQGGAPSLAQRVELTKFRDGFSTGRLEATRRLESAIEAVAVDSPETGINYYWRVLTLNEQGWVASAVGRFEVPICPWDLPDVSRFEPSLNDESDPSPGQR